mgnify:FL=1
MKKMNYTNNAEWVFILLRRKTWRSGLRQVFLMQQMEIQASYVV